MDDTEREEIRGFATEVRESARHPRGGQVRARRGVWRVAFRHHADGGCQLTMQLAEPLTPSLDDWCALGVIAGQLGALGLCADLPPNPAAPIEWAWTEPNPP